MTTELRDDLIKFSLDNLPDVFENNQTHNPELHLTLFHFLPPFLECLRELVSHHSHSHALCILVFTHL